MLRITAIICARNDATYLEEVLTYLHSEKINVAFIDHGSTDRTQELVQERRTENVISVTHLPYEGFFSLSAQLDLKLRISAATQSDWIIHQDADEILCSRHGWGGLRDVIERANSEGFTAINFDELVMLPADPLLDDFLSNNRRCYFFAPHPTQKRLMRAWRHTAHFSNIASGGHSLEGAGVELYPENQLLKHFIVRSQQHAYEKYLGRAFAAEDRARGWHGNRVNLSRENLTLPGTAPELRELTSVRQAPDPMPVRQSRHYWDW